MATGIVVIIGTIGTVAMRALIERRIAIIIMAGVMMIAITTADGITNNCRFESPA